MDKKTKYRKNIFICRRLIVLSYSLSTLRFTLLGSKNARSRRTMPRFVRSLTLVLVYARTPSIFSLPHGRSSPDCSSSSRSTSPLDLNGAVGRTRYKKKTPGSHEAPSPENGCRVAKSLNRATRQRECNNRQSWTRLFGNLIHAIRR